MRLDREGPVADALVSVSLANLCLLRVWGALLNPANHYFLKEANHYFLRSPPGWHAYAMAPLFTLLLGAGFFALSRWARSPGRPWRRQLASWGMLAACLVALNALRQHVEWLSLRAVGATAGGRALAAAALLALGAALVSARRRGAVVHGLRLVLLALAPFCLMTFTQSALEAWRFRFSGERTSFADKPTAAPLPPTPGARRLVFLVFDGLDQHLLFSARPPDLRMPAFDRLHGQAVSATQAYPVDHSTAVSLPSIVIGRRVDKVERTSADDLYLWMDGASEGVRWSEQDNLFRRTRALGLNGSLLGWYHPYCRILARDVARCDWFAYVPDPNQSMAVSVGRQLALLVDTVPLAARFDLLGKAGLGALREPDAPTWFLRQFRAVHSRALAEVADPELNLVFVHYPVPHWPNVYDRFTGRFKADGRGEYADNLALTDRTLAELRAALDASGLAESTAILLTSDHWHRRPGWRERGETKPVVGNPEQRVPLLLFLPGAAKGAETDRPLENVVAQDLALAVLRGEVNTSEQAVTWLETGAAPAHTAPGHGAGASGR